jgi:thiol:disulfide interchange protein DsbD
MQKRNIFLISFLFSISSLAQSPIKWDFSAKKIAGKNYEVHLTASVSQGWHTYSQATPEGGPFPTKIIFNKNPLIVAEGKINEVGNMVIVHDNGFGVDVHYFSDKVDFVQVIKLKNIVKTNINGAIEFMACTDKMCLPPKTIPFKIPIK